MNNYTSSIVPPNLHKTLISFKSTLLAVSISIIFFTALTAIGANSVEFYDTILLAKDVLTHYINWSSSLSSIFLATELITSKALFKAT